MSERLIISKPKLGTYPEYFEQYINIVPSDDLLAYFLSQKETVASLAASLTEGELLYKYAEGKWSVKDVFAHVIDTERIFNYRTLCIARGDKTDLPGFAENEYAVEAHADKRSKESLIAEYNAVRSSTIELFKSFDEVMLDREGLADHTKRSVRAMGYIAAGHELHHLNVIRERYIRK